MSVDFEEPIEAQRCSPNAIISSGWGLCHQILLICPPKFFIVFTRDEHRRHNEKRYENQDSLQAESHICLLSGHRFSYTPEGLIHVVGKHCASYSTRTVSVVGAHCSDRR